MYKRQLYNYCKKRRITYIENINIYIDNIYIISIYSIYMFWDNLYIRSTFDEDAVNAKNVNWIKLKQLRIGAMRVKLRSSVHRDNRSC